MELRAFGKNKKRTWYNTRKFEKGDYMTIVIAILLLIIAIITVKLNNGRFYNPFV